MENLEDIKVGDKVILYFRNNQYMCDVKRTTKNLVITLGGDKFYKKNGIMVGSISSPAPYIRKATEEYLFQLKHRNELLRKIHDCRLYFVPTDVLEKVYKLIKK